MAAAHLKKVGMDIETTSGNQKNRKRWNMLQLIQLIGNRSVTGLGIKRALKEAESLRGKYVKRLSNLQKNCIWRIMRRKIQ